MMKGVKATVIMDRTLYIDVNEKDTKEKIIDNAMKEIVLPINALYVANNALKRVGIKVDKLDLKDWEVKDVKYEVIE